MPRSVLLLLLCLCTSAGGQTAAGGPPVLDPSRDGYVETRSGITNLYSQEMLLRCVERWRTGRSLHRPHARGQATRRDPSRSDAARRAGLDRPVSVRRIRDAMGRLPVPGRLHGPGGARDSPDREAPQRERSGLGAARADRRPTRAVPRARWAGQAARNLRIPRRLLQGRRDVSEVGHRHRRPVCRIHPERRARSSRDLPAHGTGEPGRRRTAAGGRAGGIRRRVPSFRERGRRASTRFS